MGWFGALEKEFAHGAASELTHGIPKLLEKEAATATEKSVVHEVESSAAKNVGAGENIGSEGVKSKEWGPHKKPKLSVKTKLLGATTLATGIGVTAAATGNSPMGVVSEITSYLSKEAATLFGDAAEGACEGATGNSFLCKHGTMILIGGAGILVLLSISR